LSAVILTKLKWLSGSVAHASSPSCRDMLFGTSTGAADARAVSCPVLER
jgi:hypothetical protein